MSEANAETKSNTREVLVSVLLLQLLVVIVAAGAWLWSQFWMYSAVGALSEDLVRRGGLDTNALGIDLTGYRGSLGSWLMQGHDKNASSAGLAVIAAGLVGPIVGLCVLYVGRDNRSAG